MRPPLSSSGPHTHSHTSHAMAKNRTIIAGNWKMNLTAEQSKALIKELIPSSQSLTSTEVWVAPSFPSLSAVHEAISGTGIKLGAQNVHWESKGAFTGEISPSMLAEFGCSFAIIGHSERRHLLRETDEIIAKRVEGAIKANLVALLCIGETLEERENGTTEQVLERQLETALSSLPKVEGTASKLVIAYEPVWAIGTGKVASIQEITHAHQFVYEQVRSIGFAHPIPVLYGGSVTPANFGEIVEIREVDGALVGGASLEAGKFAELIRLGEKRSPR